jgi:hypothetical protein
MGGDAVAGAGLLGGGFEEELQDVALSQAGGQRVEGAVLLALSPEAAGFAAGGKGGP